MKKFRIIKIAAVVSLLFFINQGFANNANNSAKNNSANSHNHNISNSNQTGQTQTGNSSDSSATQATPPAQDKAGTTQDSTEFQKVIDDFKIFVSKIPPEVREEIVTYRTAIARLNQEKRDLYKKLSGSAQDYLKQEQEYKKKLPMRKNLINIQSPGEDPKSDKAADKSVK